MFAWGRGLILHTEGGLNVCMGRGHILPTEGVLIFAWGRGHILYREGGLNVCMGAWSHTLYRGGLNVCMGAWSHTSYRGGHIEFLPGGVVTYFLQRGVLMFAWGRGHILPTEGVI